MACCFDLWSSMSSCSNPESLVLQTARDAVLLLQAISSFQHPPAAHPTSGPSCGGSTVSAKRPNGNIFYQSGTAQNRGRPKVKVYMHLILVSVITFSVTNISKPYLWLAGHVSVLSNPGYRLCGFPMIYLRKICGMLKMELSTLLYGTSVHVRKWKYFQKW